MRHIFTKKPEIMLLLGTTFLSFLFFLWGINSWQFSYVGDEWPFFIFARHLVMHPHFLNPLSFSGVYKTHSVLMSMYQAFFMEMLGTTNFAWRFSNIILIFPLSFFFYQWVKHSFTKGVAVFATILMQSSFFLANFFKIGYDNPVSLVFFVICLYLAQRFGQKPTRMLGFLLGGILGLSFYLYFGAIFPLFILPYLLPLSKQDKKKAVWHALWPLILTYLIFLLPIIFQIPSLTKLLHALGPTKSFHIKITILYEFLLFYKNYDYFYNHFIVGPYLDVVSQLFCALGTIIVLLRIKQKPYLLLALSYVLTVVFIGSTSSGWFTSTTRGIFILPYGFVFAGIGIETIRKNITNKTTALVLSWFGILLIAIINIYRSQIAVFTSTREGYSGMSLILRSFTQEEKRITIVLSPSLNINTYIKELAVMKDAYGYSNSSYTIIRPATVSCSIQENHTAILVFKKDTNAIQSLNNLICNPALSYTVLSPRITTF